jgi:hypothetical protein
MKVQLTNKQGLELNATILSLESKKLSTELRYVAHLNLLVLERAIKSINDFHK